MPLSYEQAAGLSTQQGGSTPAQQPSQIPPGVDVASYLAEHPGLQPPAPGMGPAGPISYEQAAALAKQPTQTQPQSQGLVANYGAGANRTLAETLGMPVDLLTDAYNTWARIGNVSGAPKMSTIPSPVGGSDWLKRNAFMNPDAVIPTDQAERLAQAAGAGTAGMLLPWTLARSVPAITAALTRGATSAPTAVTGGTLSAPVRVPSALEQMLGAGSASTQAAAGAVGGVSGQLAADQVPEQWKPLASAAGGLLGGGLAFGLGNLGGMALDRAVPVVRDYLAPLYQAGRERLAAERVAGAATNLPAVQGDLANMPPPKVPGSLPTTFQVTGDAGLGNLERAVAKTNSDLWMDRLADQNQARVDALGKLAPATASAEDVSNFFRQTMHDLDATQEQQVEAARAAARQAVDTIGGNGAPLGDTGTQSQLQAYGQRIRTGLAAVADASRRYASSLFGAVDPTGQMTTSQVGIRNAANSIMDQRPANAAPFQGETAAIFDTARNLPDVQNLSETQALRSRVGDAMREELYNNGRSQSYAALTQLNNAINDELAGQAGQAHAANQEALRSGQMSAQDTIVAKLQREVDAWRAQRAGGGGRGAIPPGPSNTPGGVGGVPGVGGAAQPGGPGAAAGPGGVASEATAGVAPTYDAAAAARYRQALDAWREHIATYEEAPGVGQVLGTGRRAGEWRLGDSQVAATLFNSGPQAAERIRAFINAVHNSNPGLVADLRDYAAFDFRRAAEEADGTINPARATRWLNQHDEALSAVPGLREQFQDPITQRRLLDDAITRHQDLRRDLEYSAARRFLGDDDPVVSMGRILRSGSAEAQLRDLANRTALAPAARAGLQRAVVDYILQQLRSNTVYGPERALKPDAFTRFVQDKGQALAQLFSPDQVKSIQAVAEDLQNSQRSVSGTKIPGGSNTAQDLAAGEHFTGGAPSALSMYARFEMVGEMLEHFHVPGARVISGLINVLGNGFRHSGLQAVDAQVAHIMMNPELARIALEKLPNTAKAATAYGARFLQQLKATALSSSLRATMQPGVAQAPPQSPYGVATSRYAPPVAAGVR